MQRNVKDIILELLHLIDFEDDKKAYADEFIQNCKKQALLNLLVALPQEKQNEFKQQIAGITDQERQRTIIAAYVTPEQYEEALQKASQTAFAALIQEITPTLSISQLNTLQSYLKSLEPSTTPPNF